MQARYLVGIFAGLLASIQVFASDQEAGQDGLVAEVTNAQHPEVSIFEQTDTYHYRRDPRGPVSAEWNRSPNAQERQEWVQYQKRLEAENGQKTISRTVSISFDTSRKGPEGKTLKGRTTYHFYCGESCDERVSLIKEQLSQGNAIKFSYNCNKKSDDEGTCHVEGYALGKPSTPGIFGPLTDWLTGNSKPLKLGEFGSGQGSGYETKLTNFVYDQRGPKLGQSASDSEPKSSNAAAAPAN
jgi:hypothetical protein